ncbi:MAG TPA: TerB family tellurite resistance protein [Alphaproteobacteria bacterium]|nr:TerB family tellurite resistance protein [Alphaproteobacteria bacterium]
MLDRILSLLARTDKPEPVRRHDRLHLAAATLLVEAAQMDEGAGAGERRRMAELLARRFALTPEETDALIEEAEEEADRSSQLFAFTREIKDAFDYEERVELIEMLWDVAYADDHLHHLEANLMRRLAGLLHVEDRDSGAARKRVLARRG